MLEQAIHTAQYSSMKRGIPRNLSKRDHIGLDPANNLFPYHIPVFKSRKFKKESKSNQIGRKKEEQGEK